MKWFDDVFLKSLFDQTGANRDKWITAKQTAICIKYMHRNTAHIETASGTYKHDNYYYQWENRQVFLSYSKLNGCSTINFSLTPEEIEESNKAYKPRKRPTGTRSGTQQSPDKLYYYRFTADFITCYHDVYVRLSVYYYRFMITCYHGFCGLFTSYHSLFISVLHLAL